ALHIPQLDVLGASAGAPSSLQFALRHPERCKSLVLLVPVMFTPRTGGAPAATHRPGQTVLLDTVLDSDFLIWLMPRLSRAMVEKSFLGTPPAVVEHADAKEQARVARMIAQVLPLDPRRPGLLNDMKIIDGMQRYHLEQVSVPTLVISTYDDLFGTYDAALYTAVHIPHARFIGYTSGGHMMVGDQDDAKAVIAAFFARGAGPGQSFAGRSPQ
ncbi:MAG TPA: alpha/beta hydrolase, partial [Gammaproteobacteria bacterium]|nr:alpha/beta hydrolase [Gammaproteobacteria bacterium]